MSVHVGEHILHTTSFPLIWGATNFYAETTRSKWIKILGFWKLQLLPKCVHRLGYWCFTKAFSHHLAMFGMMKLCDFRHSPSIFIKVVATFHEISSPILKCSVFFGWFPKLNIMMLRREVATSFTQTIFRSQSYPSRMYIPINRRMKQACCQVFSGWPLFKVLG